MQQTLAGLTNDFEERWPALWWTAGSRAEIRDLTNKLQEIQKKMGRRSSVNADTHNRSMSCARRSRKSALVPTMKKSRAKSSIWSGQRSSTRSSRTSPPITRRTSAKRSSQRIADKGRDPHAQSPRQHPAQKLEQERQTSVWPGEMVEERAALVEQAEPLGPTTSSEALAGDGGGAIVLVVHSDADRAMSKHGWSRRATSS